MSNEKRPDGQRFAQRFPLVEVFEIARFGDHQPHVEADKDERCTGKECDAPAPAQEVVERSEDVRVRDEFGKQRLAEGRYTPGEIDRVWSDEIESDFSAWKARRPTRS